MPEDTIQILSKKAFRFPRPGADPLENQQAKFGDLYFETTPGEIQTAPAWIQQDPMYKWASTDGDIVTVQTVTPAPVPGPSEKGRTKPSDTGGK
jgi:hypothetical protein